MRLPFVPRKAWLRRLFSRAPRPITTAQLRREADIRLGYEQLEERYALAGDVLAVVSGGNLSLTGDELANHVVIDQSGLAAGQYRVSSGSDPTTINGQAGPLLLSGVTGKVRLKMKGGNDSVEIRNVSAARDLRLDGGDGDNSFTIEQTDVGRNLKIRNRDGSDQITLHDVSVAGKAEIRSGDGGSQVHVGAVTVGRNLKIKAGDGLDTVEVHDETAIGRDLIIKHGSGGSSTEISNSQVGGRLKVKAHCGEDQLRLVDAEVQGKSQVKLGAGNDLVSLQASHFGGQFQANGGSGSGDQFQDLGQNVFDSEPPKLKKFEIMPAGSAGPPPGEDQPALSINDVVINESAGAAQFTVSLSAPATQSVSVAYQTVQHTAQAGVDFTPVTDGLLTFDIGESQKTVSIVVIGDSLDEPSEHFHVALVSATGATIGDGEGEATIEDDDAPPTIGFDPISLIVNEGAGVAVLTVNLAGNETAQIVTADLATSEHTATAGVDFEAITTTVTFLPGERTKTVEVPIIDDTEADDAEHFHATLFNVVNATPGETSVEVVIADNDEPGGGNGGDDETGPTTIGFHPTSLIVDEGAGAAQLTVRLTGVATTETVTANFATTAHTAVAGVDYTSTFTTVSFAPGERTKTVEVPIIDDSDLDDGEHFHGILFNISGAAAGETSVEVVIADNDSAGLTALTALAAPSVEEAALESAALQSAATPFLTGHDHPEDTAHHELKTEADSQPADHSEATSSSMDTTSSAATSTAQQSSISHSQDDGSENDEHESDRGHHGRFRRLGHWLRGLLTRGWLKDADSCGHD